MKLDLYIDFDGVILNTIDITYKLDMQASCSIPHSESIRFNK